MGGKAKFERFAAERPVFRRESFRNDLFPDQPVGSADSLLRYHAGTGRVRHVAPGVYAVVPAHLDASSFVPDRLAVAAMIRRDGIVAYHAALGLHGLAYSEADEIQVLSRGRPGTTQTVVGTVRFVLPPIALRRRGEERVGVETVDRRGLAIPVTGLERTLVDCLERPDLAGGVEELAHALWTVDYLHVDVFVDHVLARDNRVLAAVAGCWLEARTGELMAGPEQLDRLRERIPSGMAPGLGAGPRDGAAVPGWRVWIPRGITEPVFEGIGSGPVF